MKASAVTTLSLGLPLILVYCSEYMLLYISHITFSYSSIHRVGYLTLLSTVMWLFGSVFHWTDIANIPMPWEQKCVRHWLKSGSSSWPLGSIAQITCCTRALRGQWRPMANCNLLFTNVVHQTAFVKKGFFFLICVKDIIWTDGYYGSGHPSMLQQVSWELREQKN